MAEIEKTEFEFPDMAEEKSSRAGSKVVEPEADEKPEIEVVDDTPEQDRNRKPMVEPPKDVTDEELSKYDEGVQKRIKHFTKGYHEERRAKETAEREREEALRFAQTMAEENKKLKGSLHQGQSALLEQAKKVVASELLDAKRKYKEAYEAGDSEALVNAQEELTSVKMKADRVNNFKPAPLQDEENTVQPVSQPRQTVPVDDKLLAWQDKNQWFGTNKRMTAYALGLHEELEGEGIPAGSDEYYRRIDADMQERFSDQFGTDKPAEAPQSQRTKSNVVAPATRSTAPKKIVLTQTQVNLAKRLGVPLELYARKVAEEMRK
jgi:hypothetical protein